MGCCSSSDDEEDEYENDYRKFELIFHQVGLINILEGPPGAYAESGYSQGRKEFV